MLNVTEEEADLLLASFDPIGAMATQDDAALQALLASLSSSNADDLDREQAQC